MKPYSPPRKKLPKNAFELFFFQSERHDVDALDEETFEAPMTTRL